MKIIIDSGAATNILTKGLQEELDIKILGSSRARFTIANGKTVPALGKSIVEIELEGLKIPVQVEIIDSRKKDLLLGTEFLVETKGILDFDEKELKIEYEDKEVRTPIECNRKSIVKEIEDNDEYEENDEQELYEEEEYESEYEEENENEYEDDFEEFDKSPAYYLSELL